MKEESRIRAIRDLRKRVEDLALELWWAEQTPAEEYKPLAGAWMPQEKSAYKAWVISSLEGQILNAKTRLLKLSKAGREPGEEG